MKRRTIKPYSYYSEFKEWCFELIGKECATCKSTVDLQIDHINRKLKSFNISKVWSTTDTNLLKEELTKCQTLCKSCHKEKTIFESKIDQTKEPNHGSMYAWMKRKCQCYICFKAKRAWHDKRNEKRRKISDRKYDMSKQHNSTRYRAGCRCAICKSYHSAYNRKYQRRKTQT